MRRPPYESSCPLAILTHTLGHERGRHTRVCINLSLEQRKTRNQFLIALSSERVAAYRDLWRQTEAVSFRKGGEIAADIRKSLDEEIKKWYYRNAGAMFLSFQTARCFFEAWATLTRPNCSDKEVRHAFSRLRTQLKYDCGVYHRRDCWRKVITPEVAAQLEGHDAQSVPAE